MLCKLAVTLIWKQKKLLNSRERSLKQSGLITCKNKKWEGCKGGWALGGMRKASCPPNEWEWVLFFENVLRCILTSLPSEKEGILLALEDVG